MDTNCSKLKINTTKHTEVMEKNDVMIQIIDMEVGIYDLDKNDKDYKDFIKIVKQLIDQRWDLEIGCQLDFNDEYTKIKKQLSEFR
jgi:hypothetical protein